MNAVSSSGTYSTDILSAFQIHWMQVFFYYNIFVRFSFARFYPENENGEIVYRHLNWCIAILLIEFFLMNKCILSTGVHSFSAKNMIILKVLKLKWCVFNSMRLCCWFWFLIKVLSNSDHNSQSPSHRENERERKQCAKCNIKFFFGKTCVINAASSSSSSTDAAANMAKKK